MQITTLVKVIKVLKSQPDKWWGIRELCKEADISDTTIYKLTRILCNIKLVHCLESGAGLRLRVKYKPDINLTFGTLEQLNNEYKKSLGKKAG